MGIYGGIGMTVEELRKLQRYIGHSTEEKPNEKIIEHIDLERAKVQFTRDYTG